MGHHAEIYGLDIETDTTRDGLDPAVASVRAVALSGRSFDDLFVGDEADLLRALDARLASLHVGVVATWNGSAFDLPFLADRARILGVDLGLKLRLDRSLTLRRAPLPGHAGAYRASWHDHGHLDTYRIYGEPATAAQRLSLRSIGRFVGIGSESVHPSRTHDLGNEALHACAPSDARLARVLAERRWPAAARMIDRVQWDEAEPVAVAATRLARSEAPVRTGRALGSAIAAT
jgi:DNA polymerase elongation subunit (family B)